jgi:hypothetical protein
LRFSGEDEKKRVSNLKFSIDRFPSDGLTPGYGEDSDVGEDSDKIERTPKMGRSYGDKFDAKSSDENVSGKKTLLDQSKSSDEFFSGKKTLLDQSKSSDEKAKSSDENFSGKKTLLDQSKSSDEKFSGKKILLDQSKSSGENFSGQKILLDQSIGHVSKDVRRVFTRRERVFLTVETMRKILNSKESIFKRLLKAFSVIQNC